MSTKSAAKPPVNPSGVRPVIDPVKQPVVSQTKQNVFDKDNLNNQDSDVNSKYKNILENQDLPPIPGNRILASQQADQDNVDPQITSGPEYSKLHAVEDQFTPYEEPTYNPLDFFTGSGEFNLALFNKVFREEQRRKQAYFRELEEKRLRELNKEPPPPKLHQLSIGQHLFNMKDSVIGIIYDMQSEPLSPEIFLKQNRLFYVGLLLLTIFIIYLILANFIPEKIPEPPSSALKVELIQSKS